MALSAFHSIINHSKVAAFKEAPQKAPVPTPSKPASLTKELQFTTKEGRLVGFEEFGPVRIRESLSHLGLWERFLSLVGYRNWQIVLIDGKQQYIDVSPFESAQKSVISRIFTIFEDVIDPAKYKANQFRASQMHTSSFNACEDKLTQVHQDREKEIAFRKKKPSASLFNRYFDGEIAVLGQNKRLYVQKNTKTLWAALKGIQEQSHYLESTKTKMTEVSLYLLTRFGESRLHPLSNTTVPPAISSLFMDCAWKRKLDEASTIPSTIPEPSVTRHRGLSVYNPEDMPKLDWNSIEDDENGGSKEATERDQRTISTPGDILDSIADFTQTEKETDSDYLMGGDEEPLTPLSPPEEQPVTESNRDIRTPTPPPVEVVDLTLLR